MVGLRYNNKPIGTTAFLYRCPRLVNFDTLIRDNQSKTIYLNVITIISTPRLYMYCLVNTISDWWILQNINLIDQSKEYSYTMIIS